MNLKSSLVGIAGAVVVLLGASQAFAWPLNAQQRGWVDAIGTVPYPDAVVGPSIPVSIRGWACVRPDLPEYGVPPTSLTVTYNGQPLAIFSTPQYIEQRLDVANIGVCASGYRGFLIWVYAPSNATLSGYKVSFVGPYGSTPLEGP